MIYIPPGVRCCKQHTVDDSLKPEAVDAIKDNYSPIISVMIYDVSYLIDNLTSYLKKSITSTCTGKRSSISFDKSFNDSDHDYYILTGDNKSDFDSSRQQLEMGNTENRSISMSIGCLLTKLRLGLSNDVLSTLFY